MAKGFSELRQFRLHSLGFILKEEDADALKVLRAWLPYLEKLKKQQRGLQFLVEKSVKAPPLFKKSSVQALLQEAQIVFSIGGDGTILKCAHHLLQRDAWREVYLLGINAGHLGFLNFFNATEGLQILRSLPKISGFLVDLRSCLKVRLFKRAGKEFEFHVLNDAVLSKGSISRIFEFQVSIDKKFLSSYRSDGLIVSTPTGSTAYNLAAGGSIMEPMIEAIQLTPICAQSFSNKPIAISDEHKVSLELGRHSSDVFLTLDGQKALKIEQGDRIEITKSPKSIRFLTPKDLGSFQYFQALRQKLKWGLLS